MNSSEICAKVLQDSAEQKRRLARSAEQRGDFALAERSARGARRLDMVADGLRRAHRSVDKYADAA